MLSRLFVSFILVTAATRAFAGPADVNLIDALRAVFVSPLTSDDKIQVTISNVRCSVASTTSTADMPDVCSFETSLGQNSIRRRLVEGKEALAIASPIVSLFAKSSDATNFVKNTGYRQEIDAPVTILCEEPKLYDVSASEKSKAWFRTNNTSCVFYTKTQPR